MIHADEISEVAYRKLTGELAPSDRLCDVVGCSEVAVCLVGVSSNHPSCERHAHGEDYTCAIHGVQAC